jgi:hypothetical protein
VTCLISIAIEMPMHCVLKSWVVLVVVRAVGQSRAHTQTHTPVVFGDSNRPTSYTSALDPGQSSSPAPAILYGSASASSIDHITRGLESISSAATSAPCEIRVRVEIMGSNTYRNVGESQSVSIVNDPIISTRTRTWRENRQSIRWVWEKIAPELRHR